MKLRILIIEFGLKNAQSLRQLFNEKNFTIKESNSFLEILDAVYNDAIDVIIMSDFQGMMATKKYIKMFLKTNDKLKIIVLQQNKKSVSENNSFYIQSGAKLSLPITRSDILLFNLKNYYYDKKKEDKNHSNWRKCTKLAIRYIKDNYNMHSNIIKSISDAIGYSESTINHYVKNDTGQSIGKWLQSIRINGALNLLRETNLPVKSICFSVGYKSSQGFIKTFKKITGVNPSYYRKNSS